MRNGAALSTGQGPIKSGLRACSWQSAFIFNPGAEHKKNLRRECGQFFEQSASSRLRELKMNGGCVGAERINVFDDQKKGKTMSYYAYLGPLGEVVRHGASFIASRDGFLIGTHNTFGEAMESLAWKGRTKAF